MVGAPATPGHREVETLTELYDLLSSGQSLRGVRVQNLDLTQACDRLADLDLTGTVILGGILPEGLENSLRSQGAIVFPGHPDSPVAPYRATLYTADELYSGLTQSYSATLDYRTYQWSLTHPGPQDILATMTRAVHDDSITDALHEHLHTKPVVAVMGGHALKRGTTAYNEAAKLGRNLAAANYTVLTGGGPGAMEAVNLGAASVGSSETAFSSALVTVGAVANFTDVDAWANSAMRAREQLGLPASGLNRSVSVPTWFYGHEPTNVFAEQIARYFSNALREDVLLSTATHGIIFLPGAAGTVQELFQAVTPAYYSETHTAPLILVGCEHWTQKLPAWDLLQSLGKGRRLGNLIHLVDDINSAPAELPRP